MPARLAYKVNPVGDVKKAFYRPPGSLLRKRGVSGAGHSEAAAARDSQQIEVGVARRQLPLHPVQFRLERLYGISRCAGR